MAKKRISELEQADFLTGSEVFPIVQDGRTKNTTLDKVLRDVPPIAIAGLKAELSEEGGAGLIGTISVGEGAVYRSVEDVLEETISVLGYSNPSEAVAAAVLFSGELYWPAGNYTTTSTVVNLHKVKHTGRGSISRGGKVFYLNPSEGDTNTLYVSPTGLPSNDGITPDAALDSIQTAFDALANYGPSLNGSWVIRLAAGTYAGGATIPRNLGSRNFIKILGPSVGGHPNVPTAVISFAEDTSKPYAILANDGMLVWIEDIKVVGAFPIGVYISRDSYLQYRNVHIDGALQGLSVVNGSRYEVRGGIIENCDLGISELFHITRNFKSVTNADQQLILRNNNIGLKAKENCVGHLDYVNFEDNATGLELQLYSGANTSGTVFKRNGIAIVLTNSEIHAEQGTVFGSGVDANTRRLLSIGSSSELDFFGWKANNGNPTTRVGHRPLVVVSNAYDVVTHTGTATETNVFQATDILRADKFCIKGKRAKVVLEGRANAVTSGTVRILFRIGTVFAVDVTLPAGIAALSAFKVEFDMVCTSDGNNQLFTSVGLAKGIALDVQSIPRTIDLSTNKSIIVSCILSNAADSIRFNSFEVYG